MTIRTLIENWRPMDLAPRDGTPIIARVRGTCLSFRVNWDGTGWNSELAIYGCDFDGWMPCDAKSVGTDVT